MYWNTILASAGVYSILMAMIMNTKNIKSLIIFKAIPFFLGLGTLLYALKEFGVL